jgi:hypothetical protein
LGKGEEDRREGKRRMRRYRIKNEPPFCHLQIKTADSTFKCGTFSL